jgi:hypothetical protein
MHMSQQDKPAIESTEEKLSDAEQTLAALKVETKMKLGPIPFIAGSSVKSAGGHPLERNEL